MGLNLWWYNVRVKEELRVIHGVPTSAIRCHFFEKQLLIFGGQTITTGGRENGERVAEESS